MILIRYGVFIYWWSDFLQNEILQNNSNVESEQYQEQAPATAAATIPPVVVQPDVTTCLSQPDEVVMAIPLASGMAAQPSSEHRANIQYKLGINELYT